MKMVQKKRGRAISRVLSLGYHLSGRNSFLFAHAAYPQDTGRAARLLLGFAPDEVYRAPLSYLKSGRWALTPPFHPYPHEFISGRYIFCGTICHRQAIRPASARELPGIMLYGARTFLYR